MLRRAGADQVLVVEVGAAERAHEEAIRQRVLLRPLPELELRAVVVAHGPAAHGRHRGEQVVLPAVDLLLVVEEGVDRLGTISLMVLPTGGASMRKGRLGRRGKRASGLPFGPKTISSFERLAVVVELRGLLGAGIGHAVGAGEQAVEIVEAVVLRKDHDDMAHALDGCLRGIARGGCGAAGEGERGREREAAAAGWQHLGLLLERSLFHAGAAAVAPPRRRAPSWQNELRLTPINRGGVVHQA
jgi:hypothetical protein